MTYNDIGTMLKQGIHRVTHIHGESVTLLVPLTIKHHQLPRFYLKQQIAHNLQHLVRDIGVCSSLYVSDELISFFERIILEEKATHLDCTLEFHQQA